MNFLSTNFLNRCLEDFGTVKVCQGYLVEKDGYKIYKTNYDRLQYTSQHQDTYIYPHHTKKKSYFMGGPVS